ncbi:hypothetical protein O3P69_013867 [Scylla paramamosain]|uniref:BZIP domain-containing protein n=2 Tax=Scylla paramamosain TaxID=85552 RepID=A0AAW0SQT3_SCYPA
MQPHLTSSLRVTPVRIQTGIPSGSLGTTANITKFVLVHRQSGDRANYPIQELEATSITTTSTELHTNKVIDVGQVACNISPKNFIGLAEGSAHLNQPAGTSKMAIFDVAAESSMDLGELLPFNHKDLSLPPCDSEMADCPLTTEMSLKSVPPHGAILDNGLPSEGLPCVSGMVNNVLCDERPFSPSDFLQENPAPSSSQMQDLEIPPHILDDIVQLFAETSENIPWDNTQQLDLDLDLFSHSEEQDVLDNVVLECGIRDEVKEESHVQCKKDITNIRMEEEIQDQCKIEKLNSAVKKESQDHCKGKLPTLAVSTTITQPTRNQGDSVGPVRTRQTRRSSRKSVGCKMNCLDDESTTAEVTVNKELKDLVASTSSTTRRTDQDFRTMTGEEKYKRNREQNNLASKRCREKRKEKFKNMEIELVELETINKALKDKVERLTLLRDEFKKFVNKFLFERMSQK